MAARTFVNNAPALGARLLKLGCKTDIGIVAFAPGGGYIVVNKRHARSSTGVPVECRERITALREAGHRIRCIAFPPAGGNSWSILTDRGFYNRNIPDECHEQMQRMQTAGRSLVWVAFPPAGGNSWSILAKDTFFNRNIPEECHQKMLNFKASGDHVTCVAFSARGSNSWTVVTSNSTFNRNAPPGCHDRMNQLKGLGHPTDMVAFDPQTLDRWVLVSNGHVEWASFRPSLHGFDFDNPKVPVTITVGHFVGNSINMVEGMTVCGGMAQAAKEHHQFQLMIPRTNRKPTEESDPLFKYLLNRQVETLGRGIPLGGWAQSLDPSKIVPWAAYFHNWWKADDARLLDWTWREWELLSTRLDQGELVLLGLIYSDAAELWDNHQVLAYRCEQPGAAYPGKIWIYDPNRRNDDDNLEFSTRQLRDGLVGTSGTRLRTSMARITQFHGSLPNRPLLREVRGFFVMEPQGKRARLPLTVGNIQMPRIETRPPPPGIPDASPPRVLV